MLGMSLMGVRKMHLCIACATLDECHYIISRALKKHVYGRSESLSFSLYDVYDGSGAPRGKGGRTLSCSTVTRRHCASAMVTIIEYHHKQYFKLRQD